MEVDAFSYFNRQRGMKVQDAFPDIPIEQREMLISGTHPECWKKMCAFLD